MVKEVSTKILVTGVPGWLGNRLVKALISGLPGVDERFQNPQVRCLIMPQADSKSIKNMGAQVVTGDLTRPETLTQAVADIEVVFHLAGVIHPKWRTSELFKINHKGTEALLAASVNAGVKRIVYVSSNSVGGINTRQNELMTEADPPRPYRAYGKSKYEAEKIVNRYYQEKLIETVILRPCWYYGPGQPARQTRFFKMIKNGRPLRFGDGQNQRSMSYVDNVVQGLLLAATSDAAIGQTYWIADEQPYTINEVYKTVAKILDVKHLRPRPLPSMIPAAFAVLDGMIQSFGMYQMEVHVAGEMHIDIACSIDKAKQELGYRPQVSLEEGMRRSIEWCTENGITV